VIYLGSLLFFRQENQICFGNDKFFGLSFLHNYSRNQNQRALIISTANRQNGASRKLMIPSWILQFPNPLILANPDRIKQKKMSPLSYKTYILQSRTT
jgi:hypothetical protein